MDVLPTQSGSSSMEYHFVHMTKVRKSKKPKENQLIKKDTLRIFQAFPAYLPATVKDPSFTPVQQADIDAPVPSLSCLEHVSSNQPALFWGVVCWRFSEATGLAGDQLMNAIRGKPDQDLYLCNPTPELEGAYANLWVQGNTVHPRLLEAAAAFFKANGWDDAALQELQPSRIFSSSQYFIGNETFWKSYLEFTRSAVDCAHRKIPKKIQHWMVQSVKDPRDTEHPVNYWPLIIERLLPVYLKGPGRALKVARIAPPVGEKRLNPHLRRLREMKDVAHQTKSAWLASCWVNYRNSYFLNVIDRSWCSHHLPALTRDSYDFY